MTFRPSAWSPFTSSFSLFFIITIIILMLAWHGGFLHNSFSFYHVSATNIIPRRFVCYSKETTTQRQASPIFRLSLGIHFPFFFVVGHQLANAKSPALLFAFLQLYVFYHRFLEKICCLLPSATFDNVFFSYSIQYLYVRVCVRRRIKEKKRTYKE